MDDIAAARRALALLDLTDLGDQCNEASVLQLCEKAADGPVKTAAVCIWPQLIKTAKHRLEGTGVQVATVVNFPAGGTNVTRVADETAEALSDGADEIDLVLPYKALIEGAEDIAHDMVREVKAACEGRLLKVILETGALPGPAAIRRASDIAIAAGADFIKTSTGKIAAAATPEAARIMLEAIKASGRPSASSPRAASARWPTRASTSRWPTRSWVRTGRAAHLPLRRERALRRAGGRDRGPLGPGRGRSLLMSFLPQEIIRTKRDGGTLSAQEISWFVAEFTAGRVTKEQASALAMAVFFRDMATEERVAFTLAMRDSGTVLRWDDLPGPAVDKHSTGGVGDTVSLMLGPAVAAAGAYVPMISGRGLGIRAARSTSSIPFPATARSRTMRSSARWCARRAAPSSARPRTSRRPTSGSTPSAT